jgi:hypothetical protein
MLDDLHKVLQTAMGWTNSHLHQFSCNDQVYQGYSEDADFFHDSNLHNYEGIPVNSLLQKVKDQMVYEYDFGDGWIHIINLEKIVESDPEITYPCCISGKMRCPPEDCGGVWAYAELLEITQNPKHDEYGTYLARVGGQFDPEYFNKDEVNERLRSKDFGCWQAF